MSLPDCHSGTSRRPHKALQQTGSRPSRTGRRQFFSFIGKHNSPVKRYRYTAIDDATRIRALKVYPCHSQKNAIAFVEVCAREIPVSSTEHPNRSRARVLFQVSVARRRQGHSSHLHQAALSTTQRQGRTLPSD